MKYVKVVKTLDDCDSCTFQEMITKLQSLVDAAPDQPNMFSFNWDDGYEGGYRCTLHYYRPETTNEAKARVKKEQASAEKKRKLYEQLKKEFEG